MSLNNEDKDKVQQVTLSEEQLNKIVDAIKGEELEDKSFKLKHPKLNCIANSFLPWFIRIVLGVVFVALGILSIIELANGEYWNENPIQRFAVVIMYALSGGIICCGIGTFFQRDKKFVVSLASMFIAFVALMVALVK